jgi:hypothetical protein
VTIVLEPLGDGKIRCTGRPWDDGVRLLKDQVLEVRAVGKQIFVLRKAQQPGEVETRPLG